MHIIRLKKFEAKWNVKKMSFLENASIMILIIAHFDVYLFIIFVCGFFFHEQLSSKQNKRKLLPYPNDTN